MDPEDNSTADNDTGIPDGYIEVLAPYLEVEVEDVRPVDEQGDAEFWGIPEALTAYQLWALMSAHFLRSFFGDWYLQ